ncbi:hypothetical protein [Streptomyces sp. NPDC052496]|uniref:hypothetical protein n=1 Tax=Streptomyces sp. NPDC052496 TaxID=3154951 RepID=UPI0034354139
MNEIPRECTRSECLRLPSRRCPYCRRAVRPHWIEATGTYEDPITPTGVVGYACPGELCDGNGGF